jgi:pimeloyl-ACP methyl ester carboxylesterase
MSETDLPTIVLVHGAFADASSFAAVGPALLADGLRVVAPTVPNRGLISDAAYVASVIREIPGPVVLVAHSYGGAVTTVAGVEDNVTGLVYLSAFAPDEGESLTDLLGRFTDSDLIPALVYTPSTAEGSTDGDTDVTVDVDRFPAVVAADLVPDIARVFAETQRPLGAAVFSDKASAAAWRTKPAWGVVAKQDHTINPDLERFGYQRAAMTTTEIDSSHMMILSHPEMAVGLIRDVVQATAR